MYSSSETLILTRIQNYRYLIKLHFDNICFTTYGWLWPLITLYRMVECTNEWIENCAQFVHRSRLKHMFCRPSIYSLSTWNSIKDKHFFFKHKNKPRCLKINLFECWFVELNDCQKWCLNIDLKKEKTTDEQWVIPLFWAIASLPGGLWFWPQPPL